MSVPAEIWSQIVQQLPPASQIRCRLLQLHVLLPASVRDAAFWAAALDGEAALLPSFDAPISRSLPHMQNLYEQVAARGHLCVLMELERSVAPSTDDGSILLYALAGGKQDVILHVSKLIKDLPLFLQSHKSKVRLLAMAAFSGCSWPFFWLLSYFPLPVFNVSANAVVLGQMVKSNNVSLLQWMFENCPSTWHNRNLWPADLMEVACQCGHLNVLDWLASVFEELPIVVSRFRTASKAGHQHVLRWLFQKAPHVIHNRSTARELLCCCTDMACLRYLEVKLRNVVVVQ